MQQNASSPSDSAVEDRLTSVRVRPEAEPLLLGHLHTLLAQRVHRLLRLRCLLLELVHLVLGEGRTKKERRRQTGPLASSTGWQYILF